MVCSRSFGIEISDIESLQETLASYVARAGEKLCREELTTGCVHVFLATKRFRPEPQYAESACLTLMPATSYTPAIQTRARAILEKIYRPEISFPSDTPHHGPSRPRSARLVKRSAMVYEDHSRAAKDALPDFKTIP